MTTQAEIINLCLSFAGTYKDYPFRSKMNYCVIRHSTNKKIFALIFEKEGNTWVNLKAEPMFGDFLRQIHKSIVPAFHMNKEHWISVILDDSISDYEIEDFVTNSYELTKYKRLDKPGNGCQTP